MATRIPYLTPRRPATLRQHRPTVNCLALRQSFGGRCGWCRAYVQYVNRLALSLFVQESTWQAYYLLDAYYLRYYLTLMTRCFTLPLGIGVELRVWAEDSDRTWNGFAVPILTSDQAEIVGRAIGESDLLAGASDGLTWEIDPSAVCPACGMPHTAEHSCEPMTPAEPCGDCGAIGTHHCPAWCDVPNCDTTGSVSSCHQRTGRGR